jgi:putative endonuclease
MMANERNGTLYIGVTNDLIRRVYEHKTDVVPSFTSRHQLHHLVWYEHAVEIRAAIQREKQLKNWKRHWKIQLIEQTNPHWQDLYPALLS